MRSPTSSSPVVTIAATATQVTVSPTDVVRTDARPATTQTLLIDLARALGRRAAADLWAAQINPVTVKDN